MSTSNLGDVVDYVYVCVYCLLIMLLGCLLLVVLNVRISCSRLTCLRWISLL